jgi:hypothetical protein
MRSVLAPFHKFGSLHSNAYTCVVQAINEKVSLSHECVIFFQGAGSRGGGFKLQASSFKLQASRARGKVLFQYARIKEMDDGMW